MAAKQRVAAPHRSGKRLGQLALTATPASKLALLRVLKRHRGDAALAAAAPREAHQRDGGLPPLKLLPHPLLGEQLPPPWVKTRGVWLGGAPTGRRLAQLAQLRLAGRAATAPPATPGVQEAGRLAAVAAGLAAQPGPRPTGRAPLLKPQLAVAHPAAASPSAGELCPSRRSPRSTCLPAWPPA